MNDHYHNGVENDEKKKSPPKFQFRGIWLPPKLVQLLVKDKEHMITRTDLLIMILVEAYIEDGKECWASNEYFAMAIGVRSDHVSRSIAKLTSQGLLIATGGQRTRKLWTFWSPERPEFGKIRKLSSAKFANSVCENSQHNNMINEREDVNPLPPAGAGAPSGVRGVNGGARLLKGQDTSRERQCAESLWQGLAARGRLRRLDLDTEETVRKWKTPFRTLLRAYPMEEIEKTIQTHVSAVGERYWPVAYCAKEFCSKYDQIRRAMTRKNLSSIDSAEGRWEARIRKWEKMTGLSRSVLREREDGKLVNPLDGDGPWNVLLDDE